MTGASEKNLEELLSLAEDKPQDLGLKRQRIEEINDKEFPSQLSLVSVLDDLLLCYALGGQIQNIYRYGTYTSCQYQREKFWVALKHGTFLNQDQHATINISESELNRRVNIRNFFKKKFEEKRKKSGCSEDIWLTRNQQLKSPFTE